MDSSITTEAKAATQGTMGMAPLFTPSTRASHLEMLDLLAAHPPQSIDVIAVGPLTTIAQAAAADPVTFLRARRLVVMGGAINQPGNITPMGEFNFAADALAAARVLALSAPIPASTMPRPDVSGLPAYPLASELGDKRLDIVLWPVDVTEEHVTPKDIYLKHTQPLKDAGSPLAEWIEHLFLTALAKRDSLHEEAPGVTLHDPLCVWHVMKDGPEWELSEPVDLRVEPAGQWTRGACIVDKRDRRKFDEPGLDVDDLKKIVGDDGGWVSKQRGNRIRWCVKTPGGTKFADDMLEAFFAGK